MALFRHLSCLCRYQLGSRIFLHLYGSYKRLVVWDGLVVWWDWGCAWRDQEYNQEEVRIFGGILWGRFLHIAYGFSGHIRYRFWIFHFRFVVNLHSQVFRFSSPFWLNISLLDYTST
jgi:hypothetical protein